LWFNNFRYLTVDLKALGPVWIEVFGSKEKEGFLKTHAWVGGFRGR